jgi:hypothetical protein
MIKSACRWLKLETQLNLSHPAFCFQNTDLPCCLQPSGPSIVKDVHIHICSYALSLSVCEIYSICA